MAVKPFISGGTEASVVTAPEDFTSTGTKVLITPLNEMQLAGENACYDLHIGDSYKEYREQKITTLKEGQFITVRPRGSVSISTEETVNFPNSRFGYILPKVNLLQNGLSNSTSKVDPGYSGKLSITVFNLGESKVRLSRGEAFCTLIVHEVLPQAHTYKKGGKTLQGADRHLSRFDRFRDSLLRNAVFIALASPLVSLVVVITPLILHRYYHGSWLSR